METANARISLRICAVWSRPLLSVSRIIGHYTMYEYITKTRLLKYTKTFTTKKWKFSNKNSDVFCISAQNIDCVYSLEPPRRAVLTNTHNLCF